MCVRVSFPWGNQGPGPVLLWVLEALAEPGVSRASGNPGHGYLWPAALPLSLGALTSQGSALSMSLDKATSDAPGAWS